jgi:hypothetical protein
MHYDTGCKCTQGFLLADMLKAVVTGQNLPEDLAVQAEGSSLFGQYDWETHAGPLRPEALPNTDLGNAFRPSLDSTPAVPPPAAQPVARRPAAEAEPEPTAAPTVRPTPSSPPAGDPKGIVVKLDEAGKNAKLTENKDGGDNRHKWLSVRYERADTYANVRGGPIVVYSKAILTHDAEGAKEFFNREVALNEKFPEAKEKVTGRFEFNTEGDEDLGDEAAGLSACKDCGAGEIMLHRRVVFRINNLVGVVYTYGLDNPEGNTQKNTRYFAHQMVQRWR